ncbi:DNA-binding protein [Photobacterium sagamiensis]|uniref:DNA-binding protein n=1 Tax=Photobacterium sagamiensis TaxID=2910241 RepID=UPI003D13B847
MKKNQNGNDIQAVVFAACDEMLREGNPVNRITGRKVASRDEVTWSHTTVTPHVNRWHEQRTEKEREAIKQTQMSPNFVKALHKEVEERVVALREVDAEQMQMLQTELQDMIDANGKLESELKEIKQKLEDKTEEASQATALAKQSKEDKANAEKEHKEALEQLQKRYDNDTKELKQTIEDNRSEYTKERSELKQEHKEAIEKLTEKKDELHSDLKDKTAECAEANVKAANFEKVADELETEKDKTAKLTEQTVRLKANLETKQQALNSAEQTATDCKAQRDKAQSAREAVEIELKELQQSHQAILIKAATAGLTLESEATSEG